jgi:hypothetical protein
VLGDLIEFALRRLHALSSSTVKQAGYKALQLALGVEPFSLERHISAARSAADATAGYRRTVTRVVSPTAREGSKDGHAADFGLDTSVAAALSTVVSPKNVDVVITIEQELALLDEGQEADGVAGVGDRMDQVCAACDNVYTKVFTLCCISWLAAVERSKPAAILVVVVNDFLRRYGRVCCVSCVVTCAAVHPCML